MWWFEMIVEWIYLRFVSSTGWVERLATRSFVRFLSHGTSPLRRPCFFESVAPGPNRLSGFMERLHAHMLLPWDGSVHIEVPRPMCRQDASHTLCYSGRGGGGIWWWNWKVKPFSLQRVARLGCVTQTKEATLMRRS
ncbi:unnamed protein product [Hapterophycus canaliculatus]